MEPKPNAEENPVVPRPESRIFRRFPVPIIFLLLLGLSIVLIYRAATPITPFAGGKWNLTDVVPAGDPDDVVNLDNEETKLTWILKDAAMEDKTVILTTLNSAWASVNSIIDIFLESFYIGNGTRALLDHLVIIAFDKKAYLRCMAIHHRCFALATEGVDFSGEKNFMSDGYLKMMWRRIDFLRLVLEMGYSFIFTDADIVWFRNPLTRFFPDGDFQIACDQFNGNSYDRNNRPNGGFNYVKSNNRSIEFYKFWYSAREKHPGYHDQDVLNMIKFDPFINQIGLNMRFLDTAFLVDYANQVEILMSSAQCMPTVVLGAIGKLPILSSCLMIGGDIWHFHLPRKKIQAVILECSTKLQFLSAA
ncbi:hypothetical protein HPP92_008381 [Vanilla planifolia]|uniref:Glycosyltransferase n=1 Tax=Vanilla planifolia TaxID=51239 RepID=A0A835RBU7_VANPL|nr:hypothetical protein HPP92_008381 [Vanilla planifolia]